MTHHIGTRLLFCSLWIRDRTKKLTLLIALPPSSHSASSQTQNSRDRTTETSACRRTFDDCRLRRWWPVSSPAKSPSRDLLLSRESPRLSLLPTPVFVHSTQALGLQNPYRLRSTDLQRLALHAVPHVHSKNPATSLGYAPKPPSRTAIEPKGPSVSGQDNIGATTGALALSSSIPCTTTLVFPQPPTAKERPSAGDNVHLLLPSSSSYAPVHSRCRIRHPLCLLLRRHFR